MSPIIPAGLAALLALVLFIPGTVRRRGEQDLPVWLRQEELTPHRKAGRWIRILRMKGVQRLGELLMQFQRESQREHLERQLEAARLSSQLTVRDVFAMMVLGLGVPAVYAAFLGLLSQSADPLLFGVPLGLIGYQYPKTWLAARVRRRQAQLARELPGFLNTLAVTVEAGQNLIPAIESLCMRRPGVLSEELRETLQAIERLGVAPQDAFEDLTRRCDVKEISLLAGTIEQALRKGGRGVSNLLREQARSSWLARRKAAEEAAQKASFRMFLPLLFLVVPALAVFMLGPTLILLWSDFSRM